MNTKNLKKKDYESPKEDVKVSIPEVTICIVTKDTFKFFKDCVQTIAKNTKVPYLLKVLDLGDDGTYFWCKEQGIDVERHDLPFYFSEACNYLASTVTTPYILFLNPDTLPQPEFLEELMSEAKRGNAEIFGARLMYPNGTIQSLSIDWDEQNNIPGDKFFLFRVLPEHLITRDVLATSGAGMLMTKKVFDDLGGFDEGYKILC